MDERARILVVEADPHLLDTISRLLAQAAYDVHGASTGREGLRLARQMRPGLVLMDLSLQDMDAVEICRRIKTDPRLAGTYVMLLADPGIPSERRAAGLEAGAEGCVVRTASDRELLAHISVAFRLQRVEKALRDSEEQFRLLAENATDVVWMTDLDLNFIYISPSVERMLGYTTKEAMARKFTDALAPESVQVARAAIEEGTVLETTEGLDPTLVRTLELEFLRRDGSSLWTESKMNYVRGEYGLPVAILGLTRDISERKAAEQKLRRERDVLDRVMATSPVGITVVDKEGQITFANDRAEQVLGLTRGEIVQRTYNAPEWRIAGLEGEPFPDQQLPFSRVMATGEVVLGVRHAIVWPGGRRTLLAINAAPLFDQAGEIEGMVATLEDITDQVNAVQALQESEVKFRSIFESIPMGMHMYRLAADGELVFSAYNPAADSILGFDHSQVMGKTIGEAFPNLLQTEVPTQYRRIAEAGGSWQTEEFAYQDNQVVGIFEVRAFQTSPGTVTAAFLDVTVRRQAEEALLRRTEQLEALREIALDLTTELDLDALLYSIVSQAMQLLRSSVGGLYLYGPGQDVLELVVIIGLDQSLQGTTLDRGEGLAGKIWESGQPFIVADYAHWAGRAGVYEGKNLHAVLGVPIYWGDEFLGVLDLVSDEAGAYEPEDAALLSMVATQASIAIHNARLFRAEKRRRREAEALRRASLVLASTLDRDRVLDELLEQIGTVVPYDSANLMWIEEGVARVTHQQGYERAGTVEQTRELRLPLDEVANLRQMAVSRQAYIVPDTWNDPDWVRMEVTRWIRSWVGAPIIVRDEVVAFLCTDSGVPNFYGQEHAELLAAFAAHAAVAIENALLLAEAQAAYEELRQAQSQLIQSAKMAAVGELAAGVAHELNNPLTSVLGFAQLLLRSMPPEDPAYRNLSTIATEALRARDIVRDLLDFSRQTDALRERTDVNQVVRTTLSLVQRQVETSGITLRVRLSPDLPHPLLSVGRIKQVFLNLITNALQAMPHGGMLSVSSEHVGDDVAVHIADSGVGIPEEPLSRIFEPFYTTKPVGQGTGLGLSVSLGIVQEHGGRITVDSTPGEGSTFTVWLPAGASGKEVAGGQ